MPLPPNSKSERENLQNIALSFSCFTMQRTDKHSSIVRIFLELHVSLQSGQVFLNAKNSPSFKNRKMTGKKICEPINQVSAKKRGLYSGYQLGKRSRQEITQHLKLGFSLHREKKLSVCRVGVIALSASCFSASETHSKRSSGTVTPHARRTTTTLLVMVQRSFVHCCQQYALDDVPLKMNFQQNALKLLLCG